MNLLARVLVLSGFCGVLLSGWTGMVRADRLQLEGGGTIETESWWIEGNTLVYESAGGTIGIPRSMVLKIDRTTRKRADGQPRPEPTPPRAVTGERGPDSGQPAPATPLSAPRSAIADGDLAPRLLAAKTALESRSFAEASSLYWSLIQSHPTLQMARLGYALSEMAQGHDGMAIGVVLDGLAREPSHAALLELLGDLRNREERVDDALRSWRESFVEAPSDRLRDKIFKAERELHAGRDYAFSTTSHFNVRYDGEVDRELAREVMDHLEKHYWQLASTFDHAPPMPITVVLYPGEQFRDVTQSPEWVGGLYDGKIRVPLGGLRRLDPRAAGVLVHELAHAVIHSKSRGQCPRWLHEGLAQREEGRRLSTADRLEIAGRLREQEPESWETRGFSYPMALSLTLYLDSLQSGGLVRVLGRLGEGSDLESALQDVFGESYARLCRGWAVTASEGTGS